MREKRFFNSRLKKFIALVTGLALVVGSIISAMLITSENEAVRAFYRSRTTWLTDAHYADRVAGGAALFTNAGVNRDVLDDLIDGLMSAANFDIPAHQVITTPEQLLSLPAGRLVSARNFSYSRVARIPNYQRLNGAVGSLNLNLFQHIPYGHSGMPPLTDASARAPDGNAAHISRFTNREWQIVAFQGGNITLLMNQAYRFSSWASSANHNTNYYNSTIRHSMRTDFNAVRGRFDYLSSGAAGGVFVSNERGLGQPTVTNATANAHWNGLNNPAIGVNSRLTRNIFNPSVPGTDILFLPSWYEFVLTAQEVNEIRTQGGGIAPSVATIGHHSVPNFASSLPMFDGMAHHNARLELHYGILRGSMLRSNRTGLWQLHPVDRAFDRNADIVGVLGHDPLRSFSDYGYYASAGNWRLYERRAMSYSLNNGGASPYGFSPSATARVRPAITINLGSLMILAEQYGFRGDNGDCENCECDNGECENCECGSDGTCGCDNGNGGGCENCACDNGECQTCECTTSGSCGCDNNGGGDEICDNCGCDNRECENCECDNGNGGGGDNGGGDNGGGDNGGGGGGVVRPPTDSQGRDGGFTTGRWLAIAFTAFATVTSSVVGFSFLMGFRKRREVFRRDINN
ncbi:MAG: hypothetical protein FWB72_03880 [Firmicutes bacterium]|nr:hypothetical protein [Bacillota bacterium]